MRPILPKTRRLVSTVAELTERLGAVTAERDALTEERATLTGQRDALVQERDALANRVNALTEERNALTGERNALTGQVNALTGQVNVLTGQVNSLTGQVNSLTEERTILANRVETLRTERQRPAPPEGAALPARTCGPPRQRRAKFLIVSNMRSGSTWLETALGALPDVATDYEIKWNISYHPSLAHLVIDEESPTISQILAAMETDAPVTGSKFVFDPVEMTRFEFFKFRSKIGPEVRIIHLIRNFRDIFLSRRRGTFHRLNEAGAGTVSDRLKAAIAAADIGQIAEPPEAQSVSPVECYEELKIYLQNDAWGSLLREAGLPYLLVDYDQIAARIKEIAEFVGSEATPEAIDHVLSHPPVAKLPPVEAAHLVTNMGELERLFDQFEILRRELIGVPAPAAGTPAPPSPPKSVKRTPARRRSGKS